MRTVHAPHVAWRKIGEEFVILDLAKKEMLGLNSPAGIIWSMFHEPCEIESFLVFINEPLRKATRHFFDNLIQRGLLIETDKQAILGPYPTIIEEPEITWQETMQQVAGTCASLPAQNPLCNQVPVM